MRSIGIITIALLGAATGCRTTDEFTASAPVEAAFEPSGTTGTPTSQSTPPVAVTPKQVATSQPVPNVAAFTAPPAAHSVTRLPTDWTRSTVAPVAYEDDPLPVPTEDVPKPLQQPVHAMGLLELESIAMQNSPALAEASARAEAARGNWVQQGLYPNPDVGYIGQQLGSGNKATQQGIYLGQEFITGKKLRLNREVAAWEIQQAERELNAVRLRVLTDVRTDFFTVLIAQRRRELAEELVEISDRGERAAQALLQGMEVSAADPLRAQIQSAEARIILQNSINQHLEAWRRLAAVIGMPDLHLQRVEGEIKGTDLMLSWDEELGRILRESPELAAAAAELEAARWATRRAQAEVIPNIDVQAVFQDDRGTGSADGNLQVTIPLPIWNRNQGGIREARAKTVAAARAVNRLSLDLQARLAVVSQRYESARNQVDQYAREGGILQNSQRALDLVRGGYEAGEFSVLDLLTAQRTYFQASLAYLDSLRELWVSGAEIQGLLLSNSLQRR